MDIKDIAWLAGLVEGEGTFTASLMLSIDSTDFDVIDKAARIMNVQVLGPYGPYKGSLGKKPSYRASVWGPEWPMVLYSFLGNRRREQVKKLLETWKTRDVYTRRRRKTYGYQRLSGVD